MRAFTIATLAAVLLTTSSCSKAGPPPAKDEVELALSQPGYVVLDVRSDSEFAEQHVEGAVHLPVGNIGQAASVLPDKNVQLIVHCAAGVRSANAVSELKKMGYTKILDLQTPEAVAAATKKPLVR